MENILEIELMETLPETLFSGNFNAILTKANSPEAFEFKALDKRTLGEIAAFMPEVDRALASFNKKNSQTTSSLMTLTMLESGPYRMLRQVLAQINNKRMAIKETYFRICEQVIEADELEAALGQKLHEKASIDFEAQRKRLRYFQLKSGIADAMDAYEAALKEIGHYQNAYRQIMKNNGIPENWDEGDFEKAEIEHHVKSIFRNAIRDRMQGTHNQGTMEYMEQFGINPVSGYKLVDEYLRDVREGMKGEGQLVDIASHYHFFDRMVGIFGNEWRKVAKRIGLDDIHSPGFMYCSKKGE